MYQRWCSGCDSLCGHVVFGITCINVVGLFLLGYHLASPERTLFQTSAALYPVTQGHPRRTESSHLSENPQIRMALRLILLNSWWDLLGSNCRVFWSTFRTFWSVSWDRFIASSKASSQHSVTWCFFFQIPVYFCFLKVIRQLCTSSSSSSRHFFPLSFLQEHVLKSSFYAKCDQSS